MYRGEGAAQVVNKHLQPARIRKDLNSSRAAIYLREDCPSFCGEKTHHERDVEAAEYVQCLETLTRLGLLHACRWLLVFGRNALHRTRCPSRRDIWPQEWPGLGRRFQPLAVALVLTPPRLQPCLREVASKQTAAAMTEMLGLGHSMASQRTAVAADCTCSRACSAELLPVP